MSTQPKYSAAEIEKAVAILSDPKRLIEAQRVITHAAPELQNILDQVLSEESWFDSAHRAQLKSVVEIDGANERFQAVDSLVREEARVCMLVGAALGFELGRLLNSDSKSRSTEAE